MYNNLLNLTTVFHYCIKKYVFLACFYTPTNMVMSNWQGTFLFSNNALLYILMLALIRTLITQMLITWTNFFYILILFFCVSLFLYFCLVKHILVYIYCLQSDILENSQLQTSIEIFSLLLTLIINPFIWISFIMVTMVNE